MTNFKCILAFSNSYNYLVSKSDMTNMASELTELAAGANLVSTRIALGQLDVDGEPEMMVFRAWVHEGEEPKQRYDFDSKGLVLHDGEGDTCVEPKKDGKRVCAWSHYKSIPPAHDRFHALVPVDKDGTQEVAYIDRASGLQLIDGATGLMRDGYPIYLHGGTGSKDNAPDE